MGKEKDQQIKPPNKKRLNYAARPDQPERPCKNSGNKPREVER